MSVSPELILLLRENPSLTLTDQPSKLKKVTLSSVYHQLCQQGSAGTASATASGQQSLLVSAVDIIDIESSESHAAVFVYRTPSIL